MIELKNVTKYFKTEGEKKYILKNVTLTIPSNVNIGILGRNGAGKSTFLRMLGGIDFPTVGTITSKNTFSWPMGLSGGFQGSMTGRQNVKFVCRIYGKTTQEINDIIESVQEFAEIGDYFDMPIKIYSSGMKGRLSFGLSLAFDFDYLIIDETLSTGDANFKQKATDALQKKIESCNVLLVSHSATTLKKICNAGIVVNDGLLYYYEDIEDAIASYQDINTSTIQSIGEKQKIMSNIIYCSDGNIFESINEAGKFYNIKPKSISQALNENSGSHIYLKKVFWRDGENKLQFQNWKNIVPKKTIISSDGMIFEDHSEASYFYIDKAPKAKIDKKHINEIMQNRDGFSKELNKTFYYLSEYQ